MVVAGIDGFRRGWVAVSIAGHARSLHFLHSLDELSALGFTRMAIDMPIGLPAGGDRACDLEARAMLRPHGSRVFTGARRSLLNCMTHAEANAAMKARGEAGVSAQLFNLLPKIRELDAFMTLYPQIDLREAHPELIFLRLNGDRPVPRKRDADGISLRRALLEGEGFTELDEWLGSARRGSGAKADDILDACAAAIAARDFDDRHVVPRGPAPRDDTGLPMQIWF